MLVARRWTTGEGEGVSKASALSVYWCERCRRVVCQAIPGAAVWCPCGRKARELPAQGHDAGGPPRARRKVATARQLELGDLTEAAGE